MILDQMMQSSQEALSRSKGKLVHLVKLTINSLAMRVIGMATRQKRKDKLSKEKYGGLHYQWMIKVNEWMK